MQWFGYKHISGTLQAKRYLTKLDITEAEESPFVKQVVYPFEAKDREEALIIIKARTEK